MVGSVVGGSACCTVVMYVCFDDLHGAGEGAGVRR